MKWCWIGMHNYETRYRFNGKATSVHLFSTPVRVPIELVFESCKDCGKVNCYYTDGETKESMDAGFAAREVIRKNPSTTNPFILKIAKEK